MISIVDFHEYETTTNIQICLKEKIKIINPTHSLFTFQNNSISRRPAAAPAPREGRVTHDFGPV